VRIIIIIAEKQYNNNNNNNENTTRVRNVRACEKLLSAARCVRRGHHVCNIMYVRCCKALLLQLTQPTRYIPVYLHNIYVVMTAYIHQKYEILLLRYTAGIKYTFVLQRARRRVCSAHVLYARIIIIPHRYIPRVWCFIKNRMYVYCKSSGRLQNRVRPFTTNIVSEESAREPSEEFFFRP